MPDGREYRVIGYRLQLGERERLYRTAQLVVLLIGDVRIASFFHLSLIARPVYTAVCSGPLPIRGSSKVTDNTR